MQVERYLPPSFDSSLDSERLKLAFAPPPWIAKKEPKPEEPPPPPTFTEAELEQARKEGHRAGFLEGEAEGKKLAESELAQLDKQIESLLSPLSEQMHCLMQHYNQFVRDSRALAPQIAHAVALKIAGDALKADSLPLLDTLASKVVTTMLGEPKICITVNDTLAERFEQRMAERFASINAPGVLTIQGDADLSVTDCRIEWAQGQAHISQAERLKQIAATVEELSAAQQFAYNEFIPNQGEQP